MSTTIGRDGENSGQIISRLPFQAIAACTVVLSALLLVRVVLNFRNQCFLDHVSGVWLGCASDYAHGVLYRPLLSSLGYGGTRYFPLYFVLTGDSFKLFGQLETCGLVLSLVSILLLSSACYILLRRLGVGISLSLAAAVAIPAVTTAQQALLETRGDALAAMLNLWGLALCVGARPRRVSLCLAAIFFVLAFATKPTAVFGLAAVLMAWLMARRYKEALQLGVVAIAGYAVVLAAIELGSDGRAFAIFRACAAEGMSLQRALAAPFQMLSVAFQFDRVMLLFLIASCAYGFGFFKGGEMRLLRIYLVFAGLATIVIFSSPGITNNHLLDLHVAAVLLLVTATSHSPAPSKWGMSVFALLLVIACGATVARTWKDFHRPSFREDVQVLRQRLLGNSTPVLAENSTVALELGQQPYLLDPWMFRVLTSRDPGFDDAMWEKLAHHEFAAVVLEIDPDSVRGRDWYSHINLGSEFIERLQANYSLTYQLNSLYVYMPKFADNQTK